MPTYPLLTVLIFKGSRNFPLSYLITVTNDQQFHLHNERISYVFQVSPEGILEHLFFGQRIDSSAIGLSPRRAFRCTASEYEGVKNYNLSDTPQEYPLFGRSDMRKPALQLINADGNSICNLLYQGYRIERGKPELEGLPSARGNACETLFIDLLDEVLDL